MINRQAGNPWKLAETVYTLVNNSSALFIAQCNGNLFASINGSWVGDKSRFAHPPQTLPKNPYIGHGAQFSIAMLNRSLRPTKASGNKTKARWREVGTRPTLSDVQCRRRAVMSALVEENVRM